MPFGMFVITQPQEEYVPAMAGWGEIREYGASGHWVIGSHLYAAHEDMPADEEGRDIRRPLPNRLWLPEKKRLESMNEWDRRMRREFRLSREILHREMGKDASPVRLVAYPYGDIGQESTCNLGAIKNPMQSILAEAGRHYDVGFIQMVSGYTVSGDNLLLVRRHEPDWTDEGADVVRHAYEYHPLFMARRTRVELAYLMNKPHLAEEMLDVLRRDGYPEDLLRKITVETRAHFRNRPKRDVRPLVTSSVVAADSLPDSRQTRRDDEVRGGQEPDGQELAEAPVDATAREAVKGRKSDLKEFEQVNEYQEGNPDPWIYISHPFFGGEVEHSKGNDQFEVLRYGVRGGINLNRNLQVSGEYFKSYIEQLIRPRWNAIKYNYKDLRRYRFKALKREARGRVTYRTASGATLSGSLGVARLDPDYDEEDIRKIKLEDYPGTKEFKLADDDNEIIGDLAARWAPRDNLKLFVFYARDLVTSAVKAMPFDSVGGNAAWMRRTPGRSVCTASTGATRTTTRSSTSRASRSGNSCPKSASGVALTSQP